MGSWARDDTAGAESREGREDLTLDGEEHMVRQRNPCPNMNHRRANAPVRHCPDCGDVVNAYITINRCREDDHATMRRKRHTYCVDCGTQHHLV